MESFNGRFKQENRDLFWDQDDLESLKKVVGKGYGIIISRVNIRRLVINRR